jgi:hypothetical protein
MLLSAAGAAAQQSGTAATGAGTLAAPAQVSAPAPEAAQPAAESGSEAAKPAAKASRRVPPGSELNTLQTCRVHTQRSMEFIDQLNASIQQARLTRSAAETRAALDRMQSTVNQMKQHMSICMERLAQSH